MVQQAHHLRILQSLYTKHENLMTLLNLVKLLTEALVAKWRQQALQVSTQKLLSLRQ
jgi:hypothetical protein